MKKWSQDEGVEFRNSDVCYGREFKPDTDKIDVARISIRGQFPDGDRWGYLEESHEMAVIIRGQGYAEKKSGERFELKEGDVLYVAPMERFRWGGDMDMIVPCGPAFTPGKHKIEEA